jgi:hypothetical protein
MPPVEELMGRYKRDVPEGKHMREDPTVVENLKYDVEDLEEKIEH